MKEQIISYLEGPRDYSQGVALYEQFGPNRMLKAKFRQIGECEMTRGTLIEELRKLSGMSEAEFAGMHRKAHHIPSKAEQPVSPVPVRMYADDLLIALASRLGVTVEKLVSDDFVKERLSQSPDMEQVRGLKEELENAQSKYSEAPETVRKAIRFREEFPFLRQPDCPDELKVLVADMFSAYDLYRESHRMLVETPDDVATGETYLWAKTAVENFLENRQMWEELEYYKNNGEILGKAQVMRQAREKQEISSLTDLELSKQLGNAKSNISKGKNELEKAPDEEKRAKAMEKTRKWTERKNLLEAEMESRKKTDFSSPEAGNQKGLLAENGDPLPSSLRPQ